MSRNPLHTKLISIVEPVLNAAGYDLVELRFLVEQGGPVLAVHTADLHAKEALLASEPELYFTTPHFDGYPMVLVRLAAIGVPDLTELVTEAWLAQAPKTLVKMFLADDR